MVKSFYYQTIKGNTVRKRKVFILAEDDTYIQGFELSYLNEEQISLINKEFENWSVKKPYCWNFNSSFNAFRIKAVKTFRKDHIIIKKLNLE